MSQSNIMQLIHHISNAATEESLQSHFDYCVLHNLTEQGRVWKALTKLRICDVSLLERELAIIDLLLANPCLDDNDLLQCIYEDVVNDSLLRQRKLEVIIGLTLVKPLSKLLHVLNTHNLEGFDQVLNLLIAVNRQVPLVEQVTSVMQQAKKELLLPTLELLLLNSN